MNLATAAAVSLVVQFGHNGNVGIVDITADGKLIATGSHDNAARLWDADSGRLLRVLSRPGDQNIMGVRFLAGGQRLLTVAQGGHLREWDVTTGQPLRSMLVGQVQSMDVAPAAGRAVIAHWKDGASLIDLRRFKLLRRFKAGGEPTGVAAISPDGRRVALGDQAGGIRVLDADSGRALRSWVAHRAPAISPQMARHGVKQQPPYLTQLRFSPDGRRLISSAMQDLDRAARLWDAASGAQIAQVASDLSAPRHASFAPDGRVLLGATKRLTVWNPATGKIDRQTDDLGNVALAAAASADGARIAIGDATLGASLRIWDHPGPASLRVLGDSGGFFERVRFSADGRRIHSFDRAAGEMRVWDLATLQPLRTLPISVRGTLSGVLSPDERTLYLPGIQKIRRVDAVSGAALPPIASAAETLWRLEISPDGDRLLLGTHNGHVELRRSDDGALIRRLTGLAKADNFTAAVYGLEFSPDGRQVLACGSIDGTWRIWSAADGRLLRKVRAYDPAKHENILACRFSPDGAHVVTNGLRMEQGLPHARLWDARSGKRVMDFDSVFHMGEPIAFSPDGSQVLAAGFIGVELYEVSRREALRRFAGHIGKVLALDVSPDGRHLVTAGADGRLVLWRVDNGAHVTLIAVGQDWVAYDDDGVFDASREGGRLVAMVQGRQAFAIDQFALRNNRPDLLLERMGLGAAGLREHYRRRWRRRIRKAAVSEADAQPGMGALQVPTATLTVEAPSGGKARVDARCEDLRWPVIGRSVFINGVPAQVHAASGGGWEIEVTAGANLVELSCLNAAGGESLRASAVVRVEAEERGDLWFLGFGVSSYRDPSLNLQFAHQDALDLAEVLSKKAGAQGPYRAAHVRTFVDGQATREAVAGAVKLLGAAKPEDTLVLFVAGHGVHDESADPEYFYLTHEADPGRMAATAAPFALFEELLMAAPHRRKLFLLDTCESGEADPEAESLRVAALTGARGLRARSTRGVSLAAGAVTVSPAESQADAGSSAWRGALVRRDRFIYNDLARRSGAVVLSSSRGGELSYESPAWRNGLFTEELKRALTTPVADADRDGVVTARELRRYVSEAVSRVSKGAQNPVVDRDNIHQHIAFPIGPPTPALGIH